MEWSRIQVDNPHDDMIQQAIANAKDKPVTRAEFRILLRAVHSLAQTVEWEASSLGASSEALDDLRNVTMALSLLISELEQA